MKTRSQTRPDRAVPVDRRKCDGSAGSDSTSGNKQRKIAATCELNNASTVPEAGSASNLHGEILPGVLATDEPEDAGRTSRAKSKRHFNGRAVDVPSRASQSPVALKKGILPNLCVEGLFSNSDEQRGTQVQGVSVDPSTSLYSQSTDEVESCGNLALQDHGTQPSPYQNRFSIIQHFQSSSHIEETTVPLLEYTGVPNESDEGHQNEPTPTAQPNGRGNHSRSSRKKMQILHGSTAVQHNQSPSQIEETTVPLPEYRVVSNESDECCQNEPNPTAQSKGGEPHSRSSRKKMKFLPSANRTCKMKLGSQSQSNLAKPNHVSLFQLPMEENQHTCDTQGKSDLELQITLPCQGNDVQAVAVSLHEQSSPAEHNGAASQIRQTAVSSQELNNVHVQTDKGCQNEVASALNHGGIEEDVQASRKKKRVVSFNDKSSKKKSPKRLRSDLAKQKCASFSQYATEECQQIIQNKFGVCNGMHAEEIVVLEQCRTLSSEHYTLKPLQEESCEQNIVNSFQRNGSSNCAHENAAQSLNLAGVHLQAEVYDREEVSLIHQDDQAIECLQSSNYINQISPLDNHSHKNKSCTRSHEDSGVQDQLCLCQQSHKKRQRMKKHRKASSETSKSKLRRPSIKCINATKSRWKQLAQTILSSKASLEGAIPNDELRVAVSRYGFSQDILNARDQSGNLDNSQSHMMRGRLPKKIKVSPKNNNILGSAKQSVSLKRCQTMSRQRQRLLGWMTTWLTQANFLEVTEKQNNSDTQKTFLVTEEARNAFIQTLVRDCQQKANLRMLLMESVRIFTSCGLLSAAASNSQQQEQCEHAQNVVDAWTDVKGKDADPGKLPMKLFTAVDEFHTKRGDLSTKLATLEGSYELKQLDEKAFKFKLPKVAIKEKNAALQGALKSLDQGDAQLPAGIEKSGQNCTNELVLTSSCMDRSFPFLTQNTGQHKASFPSTGNVSQAKSIGA